MRAERQSVPGLAGYVECWRTRAKETLVIAASMQDGQCREAMIWIAKIAKGAQVAEERLKKRAPQNQEFHAL